MAYVLKNTRTKRYIANSYHRYSTTNNLENAKIFPTKAITEVYQLPNEEIIEVKIVEVK